MAKGGGGWRKVLRAVRALDKSGVPITSETVAGAAKLEGGADSTPVQVASGYLNNFCRWGYCVRAGALRGNARWVRLYNLTGWGKRFKL